MALTVVDCNLWYHLRAGGLVTEKPRVLEFGQANWYGDVDPELIAADIDKYADPLEALDLHALLREAIDAKDLFGIARAFYRALLRPSEVVAVDLHGPDALALDLNTPLALPSYGFDVLVNSGTLEHVFDQRQAWESAHDHVRPGGLMVHALPLWGWLGHGFVNYHPTFVADVAAVNDYEVLLWWFAEFGTRHVVNVEKPEDFGEIAERFGTRLSSMMHVVYRKPPDARAFVVPMQGYYAGRLSAEQRKKWRDER